MDAEELVRLRLVRQKLRPPYANSAEEILKHLLAVQAQEFAYARWSLAQRTSGTTAQRVEDAVADGRILRTHILRPTWHFVHRDDLRWLMELSRPRLHQANQATYRLTGISAGDAARSDAVLAAAVAGGRHKTREELAAILQDEGFEAQRLKLAYLVMHAEVNGILVSGTPLRSPGGALKQRYALFDERVPAGSVEREVALARLAQRYFSSRGPATVRDCAGWSGMTMTDVRLGLRLAEEQEPGLLESFTIDSTDFYFRPDASGGNDGTHLDLIQCYDEYVMGYSQSRHYLGGNVPLFPGDKPIHVVLRNGRLAGFWRHRFERGTCELDIRMDMEPDGPEREALERAISAYGAFLGMPVKRT
jgi:hypothetical protein